MFTSCYQKLFEFFGKWPVVGRGPVTGKVYYEASFT